jgi:serine/threonine protein phosphatase PrpC
MNMIKLKRYFAITDQGPYLAVNEDGIEIDLANKLYLLFDGHGGSNVGDKCVQGLKNDIKKFYSKFGQDPNATLPFFFSPKYNIEGNALINALFSAHKNLTEENQKKEYAKRGGASFLAAAMSEQLLTLVSSGNCTSFLFRKNQLEMVNIPDSLALLTRERYKGFLQTVPLSGFGLFEDLHLTIKELRIGQDDLIVLLTDGAYSRLNNEELKYIIGHPKTDLEQKTQEIFRLSNTRGNFDNQSAILLQF